MNTNEKTAKRDLIARYRAEYGPEMGEHWQTILLDMAAMADGQGSLACRTALEIAANMGDRDAANAVLLAFDPNSTRLHVVLGL